MNRARALGLVSVSPIILAIAACSGQAPADEAEARVEPAEIAAAVDAPASENDPVQAAREHSKATGWCSAKEPFYSPASLRTGRSFPYAAPKTEQESRPRNIDLVPLDNRPNLCGLTLQARIG